MGPTYKNVNTYIHTVRLSDGKTDRQTDDWDCIDDLDRMAWLTDGLTDKPTDGQTDSAWGRPAKKKTDRLKYRPTNQPDWPTNRPTMPLTGGQGQEDK